MKYIRKGNDISVKWSLYSDAGALSLEGRSIRLFLKNAYGRKELEDYTISGNAILWTFYGKDQKSTGKHSLELIINEGLEGMITTDACDFVELVSCSKPSASEDDPNIETQSIELRSQLDYSTGEGSAIVVDDMLSETSINPVQNRVITAELQKKIEAEALETRINLEHIYFLYKKNENCVYYKGLDTFEFKELPLWILNVAVGKPLTPHFIIQDDENQRVLSSNKFEITNSPLGLQWQYNDLLYTLIYDDGQSITTSPIPSGSSAMPDWDAQEGEAGFIKNRTHYVNGFLITAAGNYGSASRNIIYKGNTYTLPEDGTKLQLEIGPPIYAYYQRESGQIYVESVSPDYLESYPIKVVEEIVPLADLYIPDTIARKQELTELSAEVSGLSEKVDALGEGAEQEVFWATEGITDASKGTTYDEILAAHNAGKVVKCLYQKIIFDLRYVTNILYFAANVNNNLYYLKCPQSNKWQYSTENTEHKLETLDNGNAQITIAGKTAEVATPQYVENAIQQSGGGGGMTTPSGDPMHYMFEAVGATYNATDADIPMVGIYGDSYVHKAHHWHLNELGDLTNEEMRQIYSADIGDGMHWNRILAYYPLRTHKGFYYYGYNSDSGQFRDMSIMNGIMNTKLVTFLMPPTVHNVIPSFQNPTSFLYNSKQLTKILNPFKLAHNIGSAGFLNATNLQEMRLHSVAWSISFASCSNLSNASILYMIENAVAANITITLHASAYDRAMADADIQAAMTSKQVNLAKA